MRYNMNDNKEIRNIMWILSDRIICMILGFIATSIMARYLGPERKGILDYSLAIVSLWACTANLGSASIIQKEACSNIFSLNHLLGTGYVISLLGGTITCIGALFSALFLGESSDILICVFLIGTILKL